MTINTLPVFACCMTFLVNAQEFSFIMSFEDAAGNRDTLVFGYDERATDSVDIGFDEL